MPFADSYMNQYAYRKNTYLRSDFADNRNYITTYLNQDYEIQPRKNTPHERGY